MRLLDCGCFIPVAQTGEQLDFGGTQVAIAALDELIELVAPPSVRMVFDWETAEAGLGVKLPSDYKLLAEIYGNGLFNEDQNALVRSGDGVDEGVCNSSCLSESVVRLLPDKGRSGSCRDDG